MLSSFELSRSSRPLQINRKFATVTLVGAVSSIINSFMGFKVVPGRPVEALHTVTKSREYLRSKAEVTDTET